MLERDLNNTYRNRVPIRERSNKNSPIRAKFLIAFTRPIRLEEGGFRTIVTKEKRRSTKIRFIVIK